MKIINYIIKYIVIFKPLSAVAHSVLHQPIYVPYYFHQNTYPPETNTSNKSTYIIINLN